MIVAEFFRVLGREFGADGGTRRREGEVGQEGGTSHAATARFVWKWRGKGFEGRDEPSSYIMGREVLIIVAHQNRLPHGGSDW
jgi:hypothetical protein